MDEDKKIVQAEAEKLKKLRPRVSPITKSQVSNLTHAIEDAIYKALDNREEVKKAGKTQKVEVTNPTKIEFPEVQKVYGIKTMIAKLDALLEKIPGIQKVTGTVRAVVAFPPIQKVTGSVRAVVEFPAVQKVIGTVIAKVEFPKIQKIEGSVTTNIPVAKGQQVGEKTANPSIYVPVRLTTGKQFYDAMSSFGIAARAMTSAFANKAGGAISVILGPNVMVNSVPVTMATDQPPTTVSGTVGDIDRVDALMNGAVPIYPVNVPIGVTQQGQTLLVSGIANKVIKVLNIVLVSSGNVEAAFMSSATAYALTGKIPFGPDSGFAPGYAKIGQFVTPVGEGVTISLDNPMNMGGWLTYVAY